MKRLLLAAALIVAVVPATARQTPRQIRPLVLPEYVLNDQGGVVSCDLEHNPFVTAKMVAFCSGARIPSADPARFDCREAEVQSEFDFCGLPYPTRGR